MDAKDAIVKLWDGSEHITKTYLEDLGDADLLIRPVEGMNHIAWQLGHLITAEYNMIEGVKPGTSPALPEGFQAAHSKDAVTINDPAHFYPKSEYLRVAAAQREASKKLLESLSQSDLDAPGPEKMRRFAPTVGAVLLAIGSHSLMHVGQFVSVRRKLGKPALF